VGTSFRNPTTAKGTLLGTMPVIDEDMIKKAQQQIQQSQPPAPPPHAGQGSAPPPDSKDKK
jgi:hypothetical protein